MRTNYLQPAPIWRILAAVFYDTLCIMALLLMGALLAVVLNHGNAVTGHLALFRFYLATICCGYFIICWVNNGQTLGMRAWRLVITNYQFERITCTQALVRLTAAIPSYGFALLGLAWKKVNKNQRSWHDSLSRTQISKIK